MSTGGHRRAHSEGYESMVGRAMPREPLAPRLRRPASKGARTATDAMSMLDPGRDDTQACIACCISCCIGCIVSFMLRCMP